MKKLYSGFKAPAFVSSLKAVAIKGRVQHRLRSEHGFYLAGVRRYEWLNDFDSVRNWTATIRTETHRHFCLTRLNLFLEFLGLENPDELLSWDDKRVVESSA